MSPLLWRAGLRHHRRHPWQLLLAIIGITLGVAVVVAVDLANGSARRAFTLSVEAVAGRATHQISADPLGLDERLYAQLKRKGMAPAAPVVEGYVTLDGRSFRLLGLDPFAERPFARGFAPDVAAGDVLRRLLVEPQTVLLSSATAAALGIRPGARVAVEVGGRRTEIVVAGLLDARTALDRQLLTGVMVADIATAQELLDQEGRLTRIDLLLPDAAAERLARALPPGTTLQPAGARASVLAQMTRAFSVNLTALSLLALLVGMFLIYNTMTFSVVQRRPLFGALRGLGVGRNDLFVQTLAEALALGAVGTLLGLALGVGLAQGLVKLVTRTINDLYFVLNVSGLLLTAAPLLKGALLGLGATAVAAFLPALAATRTPPRLVMLRSREEQGQRRRLPRITAAGAGLTGLGSTLVLWPGGGLTAGFIAVFFLIVGFALMVPAFTVAGLWLLERLAGPRLATPGRLAIRGIGAGLSRTAVAIAALTVAVAASVGMGLMVGSFRTTVGDWLAYSLQADIYISPPAASSARQSPPLADGVLDTVRTTPGVSHLSTYRGVEVDSPLGPVRLHVLDLAPESRTGYRFTDGDRERIFAAFERGAVLVSEPFAYRHGLAVGDRVTLQTPGGPAVFPVAGVFYDYESDRGTVEMARHTYGHHFDDPAVSGLGVYLQGGADLDTVRAELDRRLTPLQALRVRSNRDLRQASLAIFDRTFTITEVLRLLAVVVAFTGVFSALLALQLERSREFAILRATGMTPRELRRLVLGQTGLMGLAAGLLALPLGLLLTWVLIEVINRRAFGWSLNLTLDPAVLAQGVALALAAALLAGLYPARRLAQSPPAAALREE